MSTPNEPRSPFRALPNPKRIWLGAPGSREESLGRLARLTPSIVAAAARSEIKDGGKGGLEVGRDEVGAEPVWKTEL